MLFEISAGLAVMPAAPGAERHGGQWAELAVEIGGEGEFCFPWELLGSGPGVHRGGWLSFPPWRVFSPYSIQACAVSPHGWTCCGWGVRLEMTWGSYCPTWLICLSLVLTKQNVFIGQRTEAWQSLSLIKKKKQAQLWLNQKHQHSIQLLAVLVRAFQGEIQSFAQF